MALTLALAASCTNLPVATEDAKTPDVFDRIRALDILPRSPQPEPGAVIGGQRAKPMVYTGVVVPATEAGARAQAGGGGGAGGGAGGEGYELNFENTPIAMVAKAVLGDILGVGYAVDPRVQGTISLTSGKPVPKSDLVFVLESVLRMNNVVMVRDGGGYRIIPLGDATGGGNTDSVAGHPEPGYGVSVLTLQYVSATALVKLLDSFAIRPGMVRADPVRNILLIQGTGPERRNTMETALSFDVDWMRGQSVGIFPVQYSSPEPIIAEIEKILDSADGGLSQGNIKFQVMARMNAILVVTKKPDLLRAAETWIKRLDTTDTTRTAVHVYRVNFGEARQIAKVLTDVFNGGSSSSSFDTPSSTAPRSATERLSLGGGAAGGGAGGGGGGGAAGASSGLGGGGAGGAGGARGGASGFQSTIGTANSANANALEARGSGGGAGSGGPVLEGVRITADPSSNSLLIFASNENYQLIRRTLAQLDRPQLQVAIDATVAEVTLNDTLSYGVQFFLQKGKVGLINSAGTNPLGPQGGLSSTGVAGAAGSAVGALLGQTLPGFNFLVGSQSNPNVVIDALHSVTDVKVLSNPSLVVTDNQVATLSVGDDVPISTGTANVLTTQNTIVNTIDYRSTGIILRVVPRVSGNGTVRLEIEQEISQVAPGSSANLTPTISQRKVKSSIQVTTGQTVLLAGLIQEQKDTNQSGIPLLDQVPGLGNVVGNTGHNITRTELIIFIRPQIIRDAVDAHYVAEELRTKLKGTLAPAPPYVGPAPRAR
ncbi:MAG TPA: type II secretion system secretin GspD [Xanthobacteraceae bacterium]|nr:type II secretion system secretin GspD [Xanthobacteraceae bacterium]